jgi:hypothetical protein
MSTEARNRPRIPLQFHRPTPIAFASASSIRGAANSLGPVPFHLSNLTTIYYPSDGGLVTRFLFRALYRVDSI